ncbi:MAG: amidohydrolase family protein [Armatimonadota bacterium]|nr:amidohydrolase family protein [Armatimonadota bacterium]
MIIDAHAHLGYDEVFDVDFPESELIESQETNGIDITLVQPPTVHDLAGLRRHHDTVADLVRRYPGRFYGIACPNPHLPGDEYETESRRCIEELGFVALKLHPFGHAVNPGGKHGRRVFEVAETLGVPVMVHSGAGIPWAAPSLLRPIAVEHPNLKIVLAHAGAMILSTEATLLAADCPNVYLEPSWVGGFAIRNWVREFGANRVMLGSDHADNAATELAKYRSIGLTEDELSWALGKTAMTVFGLKVGK